MASSPSPSPSSSHATSAASATDSSRRHVDSTLGPALPEPLPATGRVDQITPPDGGQTELETTASIRSPPTAPGNGLAADKDGRISSSSDDPKERIQRIGKVVDSTKSKQAEIDTAAPFASVKAALTLFGERVERKPQQQSHQTQIPSVERHAVPEIDLQRLRDDIASYRKKLSDTKIYTNDILLELESVREKIKTGSRKIKDGPIRDFHRVSVSNVPGASELINHAMANSETTAEVLRIMKDIESVKDELLSVKASRDVAKQSLASSQLSLESVSKRKEELIGEITSLNTAIFSAQSELVDVEEQVEILRSGKKVEFPKTVPSHSKEERTAETNLLQSKLEKVDLSIRKLRDELILPKGLESRSAADINVNEDVRKIRAELDHERSEKHVNIEKLAKVVTELQHLKLTLGKAREEYASLLSSLLSSEEEKEKARIELESMREKEQAACASLASLQDELQKVKGSLLSAQEGARRAMEAKETLPAVIQEAALEADEAKGKAKGSIEEERRARHEMNESNAAISTILSQKAAVMKEVEAVRASETIALAHFQSLTKSEAHSNAAMGTESGVTVSSEEYELLKEAADKAERIAEERVGEALALVEQAKSDHSAAQANLDEVIKKAVSFRKELEVVQKTDEEAQAAKSAHEAELRKWRSEHDPQRQKDSRTVNAAAPVSQNIDLAVPITENNPGKAHSPTEQDSKTHGKGRLKKTFKQVASVSASLIRKKTR